MERRKLIQMASGGLFAGLVGTQLSKVYGGERSDGTLQGSSGVEENQIDDWHPELTKRIAAMEENGGGTLELGDGVYEISEPLRLPISVSLVMTPNAVIRAKAGFKGDAVIIKGGGKRSVFSVTAGWIRGGIIDGGKQPITGIRAEGYRLEICDLLVWNCLYKGIHCIKADGDMAYEKNITRVRIDVDWYTKIAPGSIGIHYEHWDNKVHLAHIIGYETGVRSDSGSNWFDTIHAWNYDPEQGPMLYSYYCNGSGNTWHACYADSPTIAGFYVARPHQSFHQCHVNYSRWAEDNGGVGFKIGPDGKHGKYFGNMLLYAHEGHRLAKAFDGNLEGATILGTSSWGVNGGVETRIASGESESNDVSGGFEHPPLNIAGTGFRMTEQTKAPLPEQGEIGEVRWVDDGKNSALWLKTSRGWKKSKLT